MRRIVGFCFKPLLLIILLGCGGSKKQGSTLTGSIAIDGSSTVYPITEAVSEEFNMDQPDVRITIGLSGTGGGFKKFGRGEIDINNASRLIKGIEDSVCLLNNIRHTEVKVAYDGLVIVVNPENTWCKDITVVELKKIWEPAAQRKIMKWNQIREEWPKEEIHLYGAGTESGTFDYFTEAINGKAKDCRGDYTASEDDNVLVQGIAGDKYALGFFGLAYYEENSDKLRAVAVDDLQDINGKGPIYASQETIKNKTYCPLSRPLFIYINTLAAKRREVIQFVEFYIENADDLAKEVGYIPLTEQEYIEEKNKFQSFVKTL